MITMGSINLMLFVFIITIFTMFSLGKFNDYEHNRNVSIFFVIINNFPVTYFWIVSYIQYKNIGMGWDSVAQYYFFWNIIVFTMTYTLSRFEKFNFVNFVYFALFGMIIFFHAALNVGLRFP